MEYSIKLTWEEIKTISWFLREWPYKMVASILQNIWQQVDQQNTPKEETLIDNKQ